MARYRLAGVSLSIDGAAVGKVASADVPAELLHEDVTSGSSGTVMRAHCIKDCTAEIEFVDDSTDAGQSAILADYNTPALSNYILIRGTTITSFYAFVKKMQPVGGPKTVARTKVTLGVSGGSYTTGQWGLDFSKQHNAVLYPSILKVP